VVDIFSKHIVTINSVNHVARLSETLNFAISERTRHGVREPFQQMCLQVRRSSVAPAKNVPSIVVGETDRYGGTNRFHRWMTS